MSITRLLLTLIILPAILSCTNKTKNNNILSVSLSSEVPTLDPANSYDQVSAQVVYQVYETLFDYEYLKRPYTLKPLLAEKIPKPENDGLKYTFSIKKNVRYHHDPSLKNQQRTLKAQDFINQIKRLAFTPTKSNGWWLFKGRIVGLDDFRKDVGNDLDKMLSTPVKGLKVHDEHSFSIILTKPYPQLLNALAMSFTAPMPEEAIRFYNNDFSRNTLGTGPFFLFQWRGSYNVKLRKFNNYRKSLYPNRGDRYAYERGLLKDTKKEIPFVDGIDFKIMKESQTSWLNFLKKSIDYIGISKDHFHIAIDSLGRISQDLRDQKVQMQISPTLTYWWLAFNMNDPIVGKNVELRKAIAHAVDIKKMIDLFTNNVALQANSMFPPGIPGYDPDHSLPYCHDIDLAKKHLKKAGYPRGKGLAPITFDLRGNNTLNRQIAEFIKSQLEKIGIKIIISLNTFPRFLTKAKEGKLQFWMGGWGMDYPDAENILQLLYSKNHPPGPNVTYFNNSEYDRLFHKVIYLPNNEQKFRMMKQLETIVEKELPWVMLYYSRHYILYHEHLKNFRHSDLIHNFYKYLRLQKTE